MQFCRAIITISQQQAMFTLAHKNFEVYQYSLQFIKEIYKISSLFPSEERFSLVVQIRRAAVSVASNIAEGSARRSMREKVRFYEIARSSLVEVDTQLEIAILLGYVNKAELSKLELQSLSIFRMLSSMINNFTEGD